MVMEQTKKGRAKQIVRWLSVRFPLPLPVKVRFPLEIADGSHANEGLNASGSHILINVAINETTSMNHIAFMLIHEWAHGMAEGRCYSYGCELHHCPHWASYYGAIYSRFDDQGGSEEADSY